MNVMAALGFVAKLASNLKALSNAGSHEQDISTLWETLSTFYKTQGLARTKSTVFGLPMLLMEDGGKNTLDSRGPKKTPDVSRAVLHLYGRMADTAYGTADDMAEFGEVVYKRDVPAVNSPVFYVVDTQQKNPGTAAVLVIRGTQGLADALTDLNAKGVQWQGTSAYGHVHKGLMAAAQNILSEAKATLDLYKKITVVGHSLGGGAGTYITLLLQEQGKKARCFSFGSPPTLENKAALQVRDIYSMIHRYDMVPRSSFESVLALQDRAVEKVGQTKGPNTATERGTIESEKELHSAGIVILKVGESLEVLSENDERRKPNIIVSTSMISDHRSQEYIVDNVSKDGEL